MAAFLVLGLTGNTGGEVARNLLGEGHRIRTLVRDPAKLAAWKDKGVEVLRGSYTDIEALAAAMRGVDGAYLLNPPADRLPDPLRQAATVADSFAQAMELSRLRKAVVLSSVAAHRPARTGQILTLHLLEQRLRKVECQVTFVRPAFFLENWLPMLPLALEKGTLLSEIQPLDKSRDFVSVRDVGRVSAELLARGTGSDEVVELSGPELLTPAQVASALGSAAGRPIQAVAFPQENWPEALRGFGYTDAAIDSHVEMMVALNNDELQFEGKGRRVKGSLSLRDWAAAVVGNAAPALK